MALPALPSNPATVVASNGKAFDTLYTFNVNPNDTSPMMRQFIEVKHHYADVLVLYRMGDFYETFFEDAVRTAKLLDITLTGRDAGKLGRVPMAGIPVRAMDTYLNRLLEHNIKVAICEQMEDPALAKGLVERRVVRVLSPGTLTEAEQLPHEQHNWLASWVLATPTTQESTPDTLHNTLCAMALCDISTGQFLVYQLPYHQCINTLHGYAPAEVLVLGKRTPATITGLPPTWEPCVPASILEAFTCTPMVADVFNPKVTLPMLKQLLGVSQLEGFGLQDAPLAVQACGAIAHYLRYSFLEHPPQLSHITFIQQQDDVVLPPTARRHLELVQTAKDAKRDGSLFGLLHHTRTPMGSRQLKAWVQAPSTKLPVITQRHETVALLQAYPDALALLQQQFELVGDMERQATKLEQGTLSPRELIALMRSLRILAETEAELNHNTALQQAYNPHLMSLFPLANELKQAVALVELAIDPDAPASPKEGRVIKEGYHPTIDAYRERQANQHTWLLDYETTLRHQSNIRTLKVTSNAAAGYYVELSKAAASQAPDWLIRKQTLTNVERFTTPELKAFEAELNEAESRLVTLEYEAFVGVREQVKPIATQVRTLAQAVGVLDCLACFATLADRYGYVRPQMEASLVLDVRNARHPIVERRLPEGAFVPNDCLLQANTPSQPAVGDLPQVQLITGPNMAGKSTYMRQVALCVMMAQMGCFVPASEARIGVVDAIYTRIGAVDDVSMGQSTFMVEMVDVAQILNQATPQSLVILDEVGRGTSTYDGVAIAWAVVEHLVEKVGARTLFATHYHELNVLEAHYPQQVQAYRVLVSETAEGLRFLHRVERGSAQKSYGIQVARMAGLPASVLVSASQRLNSMQKQAETQLRSRRASLLNLAESDVQLTLFE